MSFFRMIKRMELQLDIVLMEKKDMDNIIKNIEFFLI